MYQSINEKIQVIGCYNSTGFIPKKFQWQGQVYPVREITLTSDTRDGGVKKRLYSLTSGGNLYRLEFNRDSERWLLQAVWCD